MGGVGLFGVTPLLFSRLPSFARRTPCLRLAPRRHVCGPLCLWGLLHGFVCVWHLCDGRSTVVVDNRLQRLLQRRKHTPHRPLPVQQAVRPLGLVPRPQRLALLPIRNESDEYCLLNVIRTLDQLLLGHVVDSVVVGRRMRRVVRAPAGKVGHPSCTALDAAVFVALKLHHGRQLESSLREHLFQLLRLLLRRREPIHHKTSGLVDVRLVEAFAHKLNHQIVVDKRALYHRSGR
mmetsp:Transcript_59787/g.141434  ORF Transcript_59787/g.141434 Transcript_59787/m.141434 type:complete len:234 (-) Transcript_59787:114-815(-)